MARRFFYVLILGALLALANSCSLYQSEGRQCIEKACQEIFAGLGVSSMDEYCNESMEAPLFINENLKSLALSKVETELGIKAYTSNLSDGQKWMGVYYPTPLVDRHRYCQFRFKDLTQFSSYHELALDMGFEYFQ